MQNASVSQGPEAKHVKRKLRAVSQIVLETGFATRESVCVNLDTEEKAVKMKPRARLKIRRLERKLVNLALVMVNAAWESVSVM